MLANDVELLDVNNVNVFLQTDAESKTVASFAIVLDPECHTSLSPPI